ncbi:PKD domain-containing protein [Pirellulaceae bacterium SH501]
MAKPARTRKNRSVRKLNVEQLEARRVFAGFGFESLIPIGNGSETVVALGTTTDSQGNVFVTGSYRGTVDFAPNSTAHDNSDVATALGDGPNIFVAKYFPGNQLAWVRSIGSETYGLAKSDQGSDVIVDVAGNAYVTGSFTAEAQFGNTILSSNGSGDGFLTKVDPDGNFLWASSWGTEGHETGTRLAFSHDNSLLLTSSAPNNINPLKKFDSTSGAEQWQVNLAGGAFGVGARIAVDSGGSIYIANGFAGPLDVDPGVGVHTINHSMGFNGTQSTYLLKLTQNAEFVWVRVFETYPSSPIGSSRPSDLVIDSVDNILLAGSYRNQVDFNPSQDVYYQLPSTPGTTVGGFLTQFDTSGNLRWVSPTTADSQIVIDDEGFVFTVGMSVQKFDSQGKEIWANDTIEVLSIEDGETIIVNGASLSPNGDIVVAGRFTGAIDFDSGVSDATYRSSKFSGYLLTLSPDQGTAPIHVVKFADDFEALSWNGGWTQDSQNDWFRSSQRQTRGGYSAEVDGTATNATLTTANGIDLTGLDSAQLTFDWLIESGFDSGEFLSLDVSTNGGATWIQDVRRLNGNVSPENVWRTETVDMTPYMTANTKIRFRSTVSASDEDANVDNVLITGIVSGPNASPIANAGGGHVMNEGSSILLNAAASSDSDGSIVSYAWDLDLDGQYDDATGVSPSFSSTNSGSFTIGLLVTDNRGATSTATTTVVVNNVAPTADAGNNLTGSVNQAISLSASASSDPGNDIVSYLWDLNNDGIFGDATGSQATFTSAIAGVFAVGLQVIDADGAIGHDSLTITISAAPVLSTKFYVVDDAGSDRTYEYTSNGASVEDYSLGSGNTAPRGAASTVAGDKVWVVDANKRVYIYDTSGALLGSWAAGSLVSNATIEGITTNGTDVWLVDARQDRVYRYTGAATRLSGSQNAASSFALNSGNRDPKDLVTDGSHIWVVNSTTTDRVFKYTVAGSLVGNWVIDTANSSPTGITLDPSGESQSLWIVDNGTDRVYEYTNARIRNSGSQSAANSFALGAGNSNPQGIADPPVAPVNHRSVAAPLLIGSWSMHPEQRPVEGSQRYAAVDRAMSSGLLEYLSVQPIQTPASRVSAAPFAAEQYSWSEYANDFEKDEWDDALSHAIDELVVGPR